MSTATPDFAKLKSGMKASWIAGDFGQIASFSAPEAEKFVKRIGIAPGARVLDVACGTGNTAIPAARAGAVVTGVDIAPNLLSQARKRAATEGLEIQFDEGDAEELPYSDQSFDVVLSMFGAMFGPRPERVAAELVRVCKPGGVIAMANWTPESFAGRTFQVTAKFVPPLPSVPPSVLWGNEETVRQRFFKTTSSLNLVRQKTQFKFPFAPKEVVEFFRRYFGPIQTAFSRLDAAGQAAMTEQLESLWSEYNTVTDGTTSVEMEYLDVRATRI